MFQTPTIHFVLFFFLSFIVVSIFIPTCHFFSFFFLARVFLAASLVLVSSNLHPYSCSYFRFVLFSFISSLLLPLPCSPQPISASFWYITLVIFILASVPIPSVSPSIPSSVLSPFFSPERCFLYSPSFVHTFSSFHVPTHYFILCIHLPRCCYSPLHLFSSVYNLLLIIYFFSSIISPYNLTAW